MTEIIDGRIRLVKELGRSESCIFYQAEHTLLHRTVLVCLYDGNTPSTQIGFAPQASGIHNGKYFSAFEWVDNLSPDEFKKRFGISSLSEQFASELRQAKSEVASRLRSRRLAIAGSIILGSCLLIVLVSVAFSAQIASLAADIELRLASSSGDELKIADAYYSQGKTKQRYGDIKGAEECFDKANNLYAETGQKVFAYDLAFAAEIQRRYIVNALEKVALPGDVVPALGQIVGAYGQQGRPELIDPCFDAYYKAHEAYKDKYKSPDESNAAAIRVGLAQLIQIRARARAGKADDAQRLFDKLEGAQLLNVSRVGRACMLFAQSEIARAKGDFTLSQALMVKCGRRIDEMYDEDVPHAANLIIPCAVALRQQHDYATAANILRMLEKTMSKGSNLNTENLMSNEKGSVAYRILRQRALNDFGFTYLEQNMPAKGMRIFQQAESLLIPGEVDSQEAYATLLSREVEGYLALNDKAAALKKIGQCQNFIARNGLDMDEELWFCSSKLADLSLKAKDFPRAAKYLQDAILIAEKQKLNDNGLRVQSEAKRLKECYVQLHKARESAAVSQKYGV